MTRLFLITLVTLALALLCQAKVAKEMPTDLQMSQLLRETERQIQESLAEIARSRLPEPPDSDISEGPRASYSAAGSKANQAKPPQRSPVAVRPCSSLPCLVLAYRLCRAMWRVACAGGSRRAFFHTHLYLCLCNGRRWSDGVLARNSNHSTHNHSDNSEQNNTCDNR